MGFRDARRDLVNALETGNYEHEEREVQAEKNLLAVGDVSPEDVRRALLRATGRDYSASPHYEDQSVMVHVFQPVVENVHWYIKAYFIEEADGKAVFISVH